MAEARQNTPLARNLPPRRRGVAGGTWVRSLTGRMSGNPPYGTVVLHVRGRKSALRAGPLSLVR